MQQIGKQIRMPCHLRKSIRKCQTRKIKHSRPNVPYHKTKYTKIQKQHQQAQQVMPDHTLDKQTKTEHKNNCRQY